MVTADRCGRRRNNRRQRCRDGNFHAQSAAITQGAKHGVKDRHDDDASADPKHPREQPADNTAPAKAPIASAMNGKFM